LAVRVRPPAVAVACAEEVAAETTVSAAARQGSNDNKETNRQTKVIFIRKWNGV
jgi:hypothetical protein